MSLLVEFDEEMLEPVIATYIRDALNRIEGYGDDCFDSPQEKNDLRAALVRVHNWVSKPSEWL
jgi:hypothetical protein